MFNQDLLYILNWWMVFLGIGIVFLPLTVNIFPNFFDRGYIFAKVLGMSLLSYTIFLLGTLKVLPFTTSTILSVLGFFIVINILLRKKHWASIIEQLNNRAIIFFLFEELLFLSALIFWSFIRAHQPDINGLEKFMDFGFVNSILRAGYFPPKDMWFTPLPINYYYFGHLTTAVLTKLSGIPSFITYNLMLSTIFAFTFTGAFSIGGNLIYLLKSQITNHKSQTNSNYQNSKRFRFLSFNHWNLFGAWDLELGILLGGLLTAFLTSLAGNLHTIYTLFKPYINENPVPFWQLIFSPQTFPNSYWYPNATRFIHNTIHEFPLYSFVVSDLHGHVLDIPAVLLIIATLLSLIFKSQITNHKQIQNSKLLNSIWNLEFGIWNLLLISFLLAIMYITNVWDGIIYLLLTIVVIYYVKLKSHRILHTTYYILLLVIGFVLFTLPFSLNFKPFASGIGILCAPQFLTDIGRVGPFLFEPDHCQKSPLWQLFILYGFFYFFAVSFIVFFFHVILRSKALNQTVQGKATKDLKRFFANAQNDIINSDIFILILILFSTLLILIPEFIYVKDIYPAHYRANTMFKLVYQAFIMLSITSGYIIIRLILNIKNQILKMQIKNKIFNFYYVFFIFTFLFFILVMIYPYLAIISYYGDLKTYYGLDGIRYLQRTYPNDYEAILWINKNIKGQPVILEAQGDSYTDYARVSANTGLPTVLGWTVHEWLWRGTYGIPAPRISEVQNLYETGDIELTKKLIDKYNIELVFIGDLERQKYSNLNEEKFKKLGKVIFESGQTKIYKID